MQEKITLAVLDDHPLLRIAMNFIFTSESDIELLGSCATRAELYALLEVKTPEILVLDYSLNDAEIDGIFLIKHLKNKYPKMKILVCSAVESAAIIQKAMATGIMGYVGKSKGHETLLMAVRSIYRGRTFLSDDVCLELARLNEADREMQHYIDVNESGLTSSLQIRQLSTRELEVVRCLLEGKSITNIAAKFSRSRKTISGQKISALRKLGLKSDVELFLYRDAILTGLTADVER